jgi:hypothetical protein
MRMEAEQPIHMRSRADRDEVGAMLTHFCAQRGQSLLGVDFHLSAFQLNIRDASRPPR